MAGPDLLRALLTLFLKHRRSGSIPSRVGLVLLSLALILVQGIQSKTICFGQDNDQRQIDANRAELKSFGIEASKVGVRRFLQSLIPSAKDEKRAIEFIEMLSSEKYLERELATDALKQLANVDSQTLEDFRKKYSKHAEALYRLQKVVSYRQSENRAQVEREVFRYIYLNESKGFLSMIMEALPHVNNDLIVQDSLQDAFLATADEDDNRLVQDVLRSEEFISLKPVALRTLWQIDPKTARREAKQLSDEAEGQLGLEVAKVFVDSEDETAIEVLQRLIEDDDKKTANRAVGVLANLTGLKLRFSGVSKSKRAELIKLKLDAFFKEDPVEINYEWKSFRMRIGHQLVSDYTKNVIYELDQAGDVVWQIPNAAKPFACTATADGPRYVALYSSGIIVKINERGKELARLKVDAKSISGMCLNDDGNLLLASGQGNSSITELTPDGKMLRSFKLDGTPTSIEVLQNGNMISALWGANKLVEVNQEGKVVREIPLDDKPYHADQLESGNLLVSFSRSGKIVEMDFDGKEIWSHDCDKNVYRAHELDDGSISYADSKGIYRVKRSGHVTPSPFRQAGATKYMFEF